MKNDRQINIFNISFLDLFCCALGAMILIFVLNSKFLTGTIKDVVAKYKKKAEEAKLEKIEARKERAKARKARELAYKKRNIAIDARDRAEKAEQIAIENYRLAQIAKKEALKQKKLAQSAIQKAQEAKAKIIQSLQHEIILRNQLEIAKKQLEEKNSSLQNINKNIRELLNKSKKQDEKIKNILTNYASLEEKYKQLQKINLQLTKKVQIYDNKKQQLSNDNQKLEDWYKNAREKIDNLNSQYQKILLKNKALNKRFLEKTRELKKIEKELQKKELEIHQQELIALKKERKVEKLKKIIQQKGDKSLFGIKLGYHRILFLFDRSGSIIQNNWKNVIINTCKEILQHCEIEEFAIIAFSSDMLFFPPKGIMLGGGAANKEKAINWLNHKVYFGGTTHLHEALKIAYEHYDNLDAIFLLTDGLPSARNRSSESLQQEIITYIKEKKQQNNLTKIITIAIGYPPADAKEYANIYKYLHKISKITNGQYIGR